MTGSGKGRERNGVINRDGEKVDKIDKVDKVDVEKLFAEWNSIRSRLIALRAELKSLTVAEIAMRRAVLSAMAGSSAPLTHRQDEILAYIRDGRSNKEIAALLHTTERTVKFHVSNLLSKFSKQSRYDL